MSGTRQRASLPSAALGKEALCRVPNTQQSPALGEDGLCRESDSRQSEILGKGWRWYTPLVFAECQTFDTRHRLSLPSARCLALGKIFFLSFVSKFFLLTLHFILKPKLKFGTILDIFHIYT